MASDISILENREGKTALYWPWEQNGDTAKYFKFYYSARKSGTYVPLKQVQNNPFYNNNYAYTEVVRADLASIPKEACYFVNYTKVNSAGAESALDPANIRIVYPDGLTLTNATHIKDVDYQASDATNVSFTTTDRLDCVLEQILIDRSMLNAVTITISIKGDSQELIIDGITNWVGDNILFDFNQDLYATQNRDVRVQVTGVTGGSLKIMIVRKKVSLFNNTW